MKKVRKIIALILTVLTLVSIFSVSTPVFAAEVQAAAVESEYEENAEEAEETESSEEQEPFILSENTERRTENTKHFLMSDGSYRAISYNEAVHYSDDGTWKDVDNTLVLNNETEMYENTENSFKAKFNKNADSDTLFEIEKDGYRLTWSYQGNSLKQRFVNAKKKEKAEPDNEFSERVKNAKDSIVYEDIDEDSDIEYTVTSTGVKENIVVHKRTGKNKFKFNLQTEGLTLKLNDDGSISAQNGSNEEIFNIPAPYMYDSNNNYCYDVHYELNETSKEKYFVTIAADKDWLKSESTIYPVTIDPVVTTRQEKKTITATFIASGENYKNSNFNGVGHIYIGQESSGYGFCRALFKIELPELNKGDMVNGASLCLYLAEPSFYTDTVPNQQIDAHLIKDNWDPGTVTWEKRPDISDTVFDYSYITRDYADWKYFDITKAVKYWYEGTFKNNGILIKKANEASGYTQCANGKFYSDNYLSNSASYPVIQISYRNAKGIESYWSYSSYSAGEAGTAYVNDYTGNLVCDLPIVSSVSEIAPIGMSAYFNNYCANEKIDEKLIPEGEDDIDSTILGRGFRLSYQQTVLSSEKYGLEGDAKVQYPYVYTDGDGTEHYFKKVTKDGTTTYEDEDGLGLKLEEGSGGNVHKYRITDKSGTVLYFNDTGNLKVIRDSNGNDIDIIYKSDETRIDYITDGAGHKYTFEYYQRDNKDIDYLKKIIDYAGREVVFDTDDGLLNKISYPDGSETRIAYNSKGSIVNIQDKTDYTLRFSYDSYAKGSRVETVEEAHENGTARQMVSFNRDLYNTTIIRTPGIDGVHYRQNEDNGDDDIRTILQFDNWGRAVSKQMSYGNGNQIGASNAGFTEDSGKKKNKVADTSSLGRNTVNLFNDGIAESTTDWTLGETTDKITASVSPSSEAVYTGHKSLKIATTAATKTGWSYIAQPYTNMNDGSTYTVSAYVKVKSISKLYDTRPGAYIRLITRNGDEITKEVFSPVISSVTDEDINNGWRRISATITVPEGTTRLVPYFCFGDATGEVYFDCMQLELVPKSISSANNVNLLENSGFELYNENTNMPKSWERGGDFDTSVSSGSVTNGVTGEKVKQGSQSLIITGEPNGIYTVKQTIPVQGNSKDTYILSGWAYGYPVNSTYHTDGDENETALFEIAVKITYKKSDGSTVTQYKDSAKFNTAVSEWQYASTPIVLKYKGASSNETYTPTHITVALRFHNQENYVYFDNIQLIKDIASTYKYDSDGNLISTAANPEQKYNIEYDDNDNIESFTDAAGYKTTYTHDSNRNLTQSTSAKGVKTKYTYDSKGHVTSVDVVSSKSSTKIRTEKTYTSNGAHINSLKDENGNVTNYFYNMATGTPTKATAPNNLDTISEYNANFTKLIGVSTGNSAVAYDYDSNNRLSEISLCTKTSDTEEIYRFTYNDYGNKLKNFIGNQLLSENKYNAKNSILESVVYGNGDTVDYEYNNLGLVKNISHNGTTKYVNDYSVNGILYTHKDTNTKLKYDYSYDSLGRLIRTDITDYDSKEYVGTVVSGYDKRGNLTSLRNEYEGRSYKQAYYYNAISGISDTSNDAKDNLPTRYKALSINTDYEYDGLNRQTKRIVNIATKDANGNTIGKDIVNSYTYKDSLANNATTIMASENVNGVIYSYTYDEMGNITEIKKDGEEYITYEYDRKGQLLRENSKVATLKSVLEPIFDAEEKDTSIIDKIPNVIGITKVWDYDNLGNIESLKVYKYTTEEILIENRLGLINYEYSSQSGWSKILTSIIYQKCDAWGNYITPGITKLVSYDEIGNPVLYSDDTAEWFGRKLVTYNVHSVDAENNSIYTPASFTYDADGLRSTKTYNGIDTTYQYINSKLYYEGRSDGTKLYFFYDSYGNLSYIYHHNGNTHTKYNVVTNRQGDVLELLSIDGCTKVAEYVYDAWGNCIEAKDCNNSGMAQINPIRYRGYYYDTDIDLYYLQSRYYNPRLGRFLNADNRLNQYEGPIGYNLFAYCENGPVNRYDPTGKSALLLASILGLGIMVVGMIATFTGCSSEKTATTTKPPKEQNPSTPPSTPTPPYIPTAPEKSYAATVYAEAGGENKRSKQAVAHVMNNRIGTSPSYTDIEAVISAKDQFAGYNSPMYQDAMNYYNNGICNNPVDKVAMDECLAVVIPIYNGVEDDITGGALYFHSYPNPNDWGYHDSFTQVYIPGTEKFWFYTK